jgi:hypothetical protein
MTKYKVVAVLWEDHVRVDRQELRKNLDVVSTMTFGVLIEKNKKYVIVASDIERYEDRDDSTYTIILRPTIQAIKEYGEIEIENLRIVP